MEIYNFDKYEKSGLSYGGHGGSKKGIIINGEKWFLKYPKSTKSMDVVGLSYTTTPLSEYLGSQIYESINIETHKTILGISDNKLVVACKDFLNSTETIINYNSIKNEYDENIEKEIEKISSKSSPNNNDNLEEIQIIMENNLYFKKDPLLKLRFWDMFIIDALIGNHDRNEGNWGIILDKQTGKTRLTPVFDNGAAFNNKSSEEKIEDIMKNESKFIQTAYESSTSIFRENDKKINPLKYIESCKNNDCNEALIRTFSNINLDKIKNIIISIPESYENIKITSKIQKEYYSKLIEFRYNILEKVFNKLIENK